MLKSNTLEAVFTLPNEIFYPGASASACCMLFTLGKPHKKADGTVNETFFVDGKSEWLCEAYMKTDYSKLSEEDFQKTLNNYLAYLMKEGKIYES